MIAESIIGAASDLGPMKVPVVVRLQGTNSAEGLKMVRASSRLIRSGALTRRSSRRLISAYMWRRALVRPPKRLWNSPRREKKTASTNSTTIPNFKQLGGMTEVLRTQSWMTVV